jgi:hypothetical protein
MTVNIKIQMDIDYTQPQIAEILKCYEERKVYNRDYKKKNPPTAEQRRLYNRQHYLRRKQRENHKETCRKYELANSERTKKRKKYYYYKRTNQLEKLKERDIETYNLFCI